MLKSHTHTEGAILVVNLLHGKHKRLRQVSSNQTLHLPTLQQVVRVLGGDGQQTCDVEVAFNKEDVAAEVMLALQAVVVDVTLGRRTEVPRHRGPVFGVELCFVHAEGEVVIVKGPNLLKKVIT